MKNRTEKEHYIPNKSYLDYFVDTSQKPNALWVYFNKKDVIADASKAISKPITPVNLCKESYLYETPRLPVNTVEKMLATIESDYKHVLDTKIIPQKPLSQNDRMAVAYFISTLEKRTPLNKANTDKFIEDIREHTVHLENQFAKGVKSKLHKELDEADRQNLMFTQTLLVAMQMNRYQVADMLFLRPQFNDEETYFITSDFPVSLVDFSLMNSFYPPTPLDATVEVTIPLTPKITLLVNHLGLNGYKEIDHNYIFEINNRTLRRSNKFIISPTKFSDKFTRLNVQRSPQSFVVLYLSEKIRRRRTRRTETYMKNTAKKIIKSIVKTSVNNYKKGSQIKFVEIFSHSKDEYAWFIRALKLLGKIKEENNQESEFELKKKISTKVGQLGIIHVIAPNPDETRRDNVNYVSI